MQTMNAQPDTTDAPALATVAAWLTFWLLSMRLAALQRRARRQVARGGCSTVAAMIAAGDWTALDSLTDGWVQT
jgi:hypothetical protein